MTEVVSVVQTAAYLLAGFKPGNNGFITSMSKCGRVVFAPSAIVELAHIICPS
jgi:hypothetical protein